MDDIDSLRLALDAEHHNHRKDNEYLVAERNRYRERALAAEAILLDVARVRRSDAWGFVSMAAQAHLYALTEEDSDA